jgi:hypothetical protein
MDGMQEATSVYLLIHRTQMLVSLPKARKRAFHGSPRGRVLEVNHGFHVAVSINRCWWLKDLLEALLWWRVNA